MATGGGTSAAARLHSALSKPLYQRCIEIRQLLEDTNTKELHTILPTLVESIFGFGSQPGWGIGKIAKYHSYDFSVIRKLLHPEGAVLKLTYRLMSEPFYRYEFPLSCLPFPVQKLLEEGSVPALFADKLQLTPNGRPYNALSLNAFEFYFYHFAYFLVNTQTHKLTSWVNPSEVLFTVLFEEYLAYFLPPDGRRVPVLSSAGGNVKSPGLSGQSPVHRGSLSRTLPMMARPSLASPHLSSSLLRTGAQQVPSPYGSPLNSPTVSIATQLATEPAELETWRSQTFLQILVEFWLHQTSLELDKLAYLNLSSESFLPSNDHVRVVRMLVKHLHYFVNSAPRTDLMTSPYSPQYPSPWDDFKRAVFPQLVRKKLYGFIKHSFERWPLDASFRLILETWLSYLQPWRYVDPSQSNREKEQDIKEKVVDESWRSVVVENLLFYTTLLQTFLQRVSRMDLGAPKNAYILFRVSKVFSLLRVRDMIEDTECALFETVHQMSSPLSPSSSGHDMGASYLSPASYRHSNIASAISSQITELEGAGFKYVPLFCEETLIKAHELLGLITVARDTAASASQSSQANSSSFLSFFGLCTDDYNTYRYCADEGYDDIGGGGDVRKVGPHLTSSLQNFCKVFQMELPEKTDKGVRFGTVPQGSRSSNIYTPDVDQTEEGPKLGPLGRYQMMNGLRQFEVEFQGDPDLQPIRSFESPWMVRILHHVSSYFNKRFECNFHMWCCRDDFRGRLARVFLTPSTLIQSPQKYQALSPSTQHHLSAYNRPRLSLRRLAAYHNILLVTVLYTCCFLVVGLGPVGFLFILFLLMFVMASCKALSQPAEKIKVN